MTRLTFLLAILSISSFTIAQDKKDLSFSFAVGPSISFEHPDPRAGTFTSFDMDYYFQKRHIISANLYNGGDYLPINDSSLLERPAHYDGVSLLYKYKLVDKPKFSILAGIGWGKMEHRIKGKTIWNDYVIPVRIEGIAHLSKHFNASVIGGFFIMPDYPVVSYYIGPRVSYVFK